MLPAERLRWQHRGNMTGKEQEEPEAVWKENRHGFGSKWVLYPEQPHSNWQCCHMPQECLPAPCPARGSRPGALHPTAAIAEQRRVTPHPDLNSYLPWFPAPRDNATRSGPEGRHCIPTKLSQRKYFSFCT